MGWLSKNPRRWTKQASQLVRRYLGLICCCPWLDCPHDDLDIRMRQRRIDDLIERARARENRP